jgi:hypothetical protein
MSDTLDLAGLSVASLKTEVDAGLTALLSALTVVEKFDVFLGPTVQAEVTGAVKILTAVKAVVDKL